MYELNDAGHVRAGKRNDYEVCKRGYIGWYKYEIVILFKMHAENRRLQKEWEEICKLNQTSDRYGVTASIVGDDLKHWKGTIRGSVFSS